MKVLTQQDMIAVSGGYSDFWSEAQKNAVTTIGATVGMALTYGAGSYSGFNMGSLTARFVVLPIVQCIGSTLSGELLKTYMEEAVPTKTAGEQAS